MNPQQQTGSPEPPEADVQGSSRRSIALDENLNRIIKRHSQRAIPQVESVEPSEPPASE